MCGITGYFGRGNKDILIKMTDSLKHRGPDDQGFFIEDNIGLGHRRLSVIDLKTGQQPVFNEDKTAVLIFNGEIYNFKELREKLIAKDHKFCTQTDTEVIVHLYEEKKDDFLNELNGMFALALWDKKNEKLILARDRLGQKPLYYSLIDKTLVFGSELKSLLNYPGIKKELNYESLAKYLIYEYVPAPWTILNNIYKLGPGEYLVYKDNKIKVEKYWDIKFGLNSNIQDFKSSLEEFEKRFEESVKMRLISDVPLGVFLSGGIDSSAITYYAQKNSSQKIKTFSIGFTDKSFDESKYAQQVSDFLGTEHYQQILEPEKCLDLIPHISDFLDEPLADASIIPTYLLSKFTRDKVTVALSGDGGDELLMGYPTFQACKLAKFYEKVPSFLRNNIVHPLVDNLPSSFNNISFDFKLKKFISGFDYPMEIRNQIWLGSFSPEQIESLLSPQAYQKVQANNYFEDIEKYLGKIKKERPDNRLIYLYLKNYLQDDILVKADRTSMAVGLEARAPFLDYRLVEFINSLPTDFKIKGWQTKYILKKLMKNKLPDNIIYRSKKGFGIPVAKWIKDDLKEFVLDVFNERKIKNQGILNYNYIKKLLQEHFSSRKDNRKLIWTLLIFELWMEKWYKNK